MIAVGVQTVCPSAQTRRLTLDVTTRVAARRYHQGRQRPGTTHPGGGGMELPVSAARGPAEAAKGGSRTEACPGDRVESANATVQALPVARAQRQAADGRRHGGCP